MQQYGNFWKSFFQGLGYEITTAANGSEALTVISQHDFDCVMSDHVMPNMNGLELLEQIRELGKKVPFLMITGYPTIEIAVEVMKRGAYDYITKPFSSKMSVSSWNVLYTQRDWKNLLKNWAV